MTWVQKIKFHGKQYILAHGISIFLSEFAYIHGLKEEGLIVGQDIYVDGKIIGHIEEIEYGEKLSLSLSDDAMENILKAFEKEEK